MALWLSIVVSFLLSTLARLFAEYFLDKRIAILGKIVGLEHLENPGVAFGLTFPPVIQSLLIATAFVVLFMFAVSRSKKSETPRYRMWEQCCFGMILGGALGNIVDRLPDGVVTDYVQVGWFPLFNLADSFITVGVFLLLLIELWSFLHRPFSS